MKMKRFCAVFVVMAMAMAVSHCAAKNYEVGDNFGWTNNGSVNYQTWVSSKTFVVGDTLTFKYTKGDHNVSKIDETEYKNCDVSKPAQAWSSGNDTVTLNSTGAWYFACAYPGHCSQGQKLSVNVSTGNTTSPAPSSPSPSPPSSSSSPPPSSPSPSSPPSAAAPLAISVSAIVVAFLVSLLLF